MLNLTQGAGSFGLLVFRRLRQERCEFSFNNSLSRYTGIYRQRVGWISMLKLSALLSKV